MDFNLLSLMLLAWQGQFIRGSEGSMGRRSQCPQQQYCSNKKHIDCHMSDKFHNSCDDKQQTITQINGNLRGEILFAINMLRDLVASGYYAYAPASAMPVLAWNDDLARISLQMAFRCTSVNEYCAVSEKFPIVSTTTLELVTKTRDLPRAILKKLLPVWLNDVRGCAVDEKHRIFQEDPETCLGHYLPLITDTANSIGCVASTQDPADEYYTISLTCSIGMVSEFVEPYSVGEATTGCTAGKDPVHNYLCSKKHLGKIEFPQVVCKPC